MTNKVQEKFNLTFYVLRLALSCVRGLPLFDPAPIVNTPAAGGTAAPKEAVPKLGFGEPNAWVLLLEPKAGGFEVVPPVKLNVGFDASVLLDPKANGAGDEDAAFVPKLKPPLVC